MRFGGVVAGDGSCGIGGVCGIRIGGAGGVGSFGGVVHVLFFVVFCFVRDLVAKISHKFGWMKTVQSDSQHITWCRLVPIRSMLGTGSVC